MRRWAVITLAGISGLAVVLAASLAYVGTQLDDAKISRQDLEFEVEDLRQELNSVSEERSDLAEELEQQRRAKEHMEQELERLRAVAQATAPATETFPTQAPAPDPKRP